jgi:hypothetical protein
MMGRKDMKQETMAKRIRNRAMEQKMAPPRKAMAMPPDMSMAPPAPAMMPPTGMKKGGVAKKKAAPKKGMKKGGGIMLVIGFGKKKGK